MKNDTPSGFVKGTKGVAWFLDCSTRNALRKIKKFKLRPYPEPGNKIMVRYRATEIYKKIILGIATKTLRHKRVNKINTQTGASNK